VMLLVSRLESGLFSPPGIWQLVQAGKVPSSVLSAKVHEIWLYGLAENKWHFPKTFDTLGLASSVVKF